MDDVLEIRALIERQFASLSWPNGATGNWQGFSEDFLDGAAPYPAARPIHPQSVAGFLARMESIAGRELQSLEEAMLGANVTVFGNIAVAIAVCAMKENGIMENRTVEMLLLVKDQGNWRIAAQAWDRASDANPVPAQFLTG
jgi:hypothetical protein